MKIELLNADCLNFVELNISGNRFIFNKCDPESSFLETDVFNLFSPCFERSNELYDYFTPTMYNVKRLIPLGNELEKHGKLLQELNDHEAFRNFVSGVFLGGNFLSEIEKLNAGWVTDWQFFRDRLLVVNSDLTELVAKCVDEERVLWVLGY
jgi:hypothetical protein